MAARGALIVVEGVGRCGKTSQCNRLTEALREKKKDVQFKRFPDRTTLTGEMINNYLKGTSELDDHVVHLLFSANRWEAVSEMKRLLQGGTTLIVDRYAFSGVAFTSAKPGFDMDWCKQPDVGLPKPDLVIFFNLSEEAAARKRDGTERYEDKEFLRKVQANFEQLATKDWKIIDAEVKVSRSKEDIHTEIKELVLEAMKGITTTEIDTLWTE